MLALTNYFRIIDTVNIDKIKKELSTLDYDSTYALQGVNE